MLRTRIITALVLAAVLVGVVLYGPAWASRALFALFIAAGAWEWSAFLNTSVHGMRVTFVLVVAALALGARALLYTPVAFAGLMQLAVGWWVVALLWLVLVPKRMHPWATALAGTLALVPAWVALTRLVEGTWPRGAEWAIFVLVLAFAADTGAYFAGHAFGSVKLAPRVSPGKTWEGVLGGLGLAAVVGYLGSRWFDLAPQRLMPLCLLSAAFSVVGDLTESMFKRATGLKDSGRLFPGLDRHGVRLDRCRCGG